MIELPTVRVAAIQATPAILDADACIDRAIALLHEAAADGVPLAPPATHDDRRSRGGVR